MLSVSAPAPGLRALGELTRALAALGRGADGLAIAVLARLGALLVGLPFVRRRYVRPLHRRSRALRGATVRLHGITPARDPRGPRERARLPRSFYWVEVTIRPPRRRGAPPWRPGDLSLVAASARPGAPEQDEVVGSVHGVAHRRGDVWIDQGAVRSRVGPQRLRLLVAVVPGTKHFRFRYYLELLRRAVVRACVGDAHSSTKARREAEAGACGPDALRRRRTGASLHGRRAPPRGARALAAPRLTPRLSSAATSFGGASAPWHWRSCGTRD